MEYNVCKYVLIFKLILVFLSEPKYGKLVNATKQTIKGIYRNNKVLADSQIYDTLKTGLNHALKRYKPDLSFGVGNTYAETVPIRLNRDSALPFIEFYKMNGITRDISKTVQPQTKYMTEPKTKRHMSDAGYGSRIKAGHDVANFMKAKENVYGKYGPGKRSSSSLNTYGTFLAELYSLDSKRRHTLVVPSNDDSNHQKRSIALDNGYWPRLRAVANLDNAFVENEKLYGTNELVKRYVRSIDPVEHIYLRPVNDHHPSTSDVIYDWHHDLSDAGYASRIQAANDVAHDMETKEDVYGVYGPGRR